MSADPPDLDDDGRRLAGAVAGGIGTVLHLVVGSFVLASRQFAPAWAVVGLVAVWLALLALLWRWRRRRPLLALLVPFVAAAVWWLTIDAGVRWLDWSA